MVHLTNQMAMKAPVPNIQEILRQNPEIGRQLASEAMKTQTAQFKVPQQQHYVPQPQQSPPQQSNPLSGLMSFLGGTQQPTPQATSLPPQSQSKKVALSVPTFGTPLPKTTLVTRAPLPPPAPTRELPPPSGGGIADLLRGIQQEDKKVKSSLKKTPSSSATKSPKNSVVIKL